jgi:hypothetical protein
VHQDVCERVVGPSIRDICIKNLGLGCGGSNGLSIGYA